MTKSRLIDKIPVRLRLFFVFSSFAWISLFKPDEGMSLIQDALEGEMTRRVREFRERESYNKESYTIHDYP